MYLREMRAPRRSSRHGGGDTIQRKPPGRGRRDEVLGLVEAADRATHDARAVRGRARQQQAGSLDEHTVVGPSCVVPFGRDQLEVARRMEVAGAGTRLSGRLIPDRLRAKIREAMIQR